MSTKSPFSRRVRAFAAAAFLCAAGCNYLSIPARDDIIKRPGTGELPGAQSAYNSAVIKGNVLPSDKAQNATAVMAWRTDPGSQGFSEQVIVNAPGGFMLYLPEGRYHLYAFTDYNQNGLFEPEEVSGVFRSKTMPGEIVIRETELICGIVIRTSAAFSQNSTLPANGNIQDPASKSRQRTHNGQILKIYSDDFSAANAQAGYWNPSAFMNTFGANIYLTQAYDPRKIPVLFVHGTEGSPHHWIYFYMRLDHNRYQMWHFYYPTGIRLPLAAALLDDAIRDLHKKFGFQQMAIVAHSVGGLTTRSFLTRFVSDKNHAYIKLYITFATPWSGFGMADASQKIPHKSIPVWKDLGTKSAFIQQTLDAKLPPHVRHYLFYGKNDQLAGHAALDDRAVSCAVRTFGWDCSHDSILSDRAVFAAFQDILNRAFIFP